MQGYLRVSAANSNVPLTWRTEAPTSSKTADEKSAAADGAATAVKMSESKGIGPVKSLSLGNVDAAMANQGKTIFESKCLACHKLDERFVGPALRGVTLRRQPEWIMNMIMNPTEMTQKDKVANDLLAEYATQMADLKVPEADARKILEYFRLGDSASKK
jgi:mono/diheme cytochrome c family protein